MKDGIHKEHGFIYLVKNDKCLGCFYEDDPEDQKLLEKTINKNRGEIMVDPKSCSIGDLEGIIDTDFFCSLEYHKELLKRKQKDLEIKHWEKYYEE